MSFITYKELIQGLDLEELQRENTIKELKERTARVLKKEVSVWITRIVKSAEWVLLGLKAQSSLNIAKNTRLKQ